MHKLQGKICMPVAHYEILKYNLTVGALANLLKGYLAWDNALTSSDKSFSRISAILKAHNIGQPNG